MRDDTSATRPRPIRPGLSAASRVVTRLLIAALLAWCAPVSAWLLTEKLSDPQFRYRMATGPGIWTSSNEVFDTPIAACQSLAAHLSSAPRTFRATSATYPPNSSVVCRGTYTGGPPYEDVIGYAGHYCASGFSLQVDANGNYNAAQHHTCRTCPANSDRRTAGFVCDCRQGYRKVEAEQRECVPEKIVIGFFNGVWTTEDQAAEGQDALRGLVGSSYKNTLLRYERFYNQSGPGNGNTALQDLAEVFDQRSKELDGILNDRWEHYWELLLGKHAVGGSLTDRLLNGLDRGGIALSRLFEATFNATLGQIVGGYARMLSSPPTAADMAAHIAKLIELASEHHSFVLVAHSQGNLFVNSAYDELRVSRPTSKAAVIHIAPASPTLRGEHLLADIDLVINGLRLLGPASVPAVNVAMPMSNADLTGHTLTDTYLDLERVARERVSNAVQQALGGL